MTVTESSFSCRRNQPEKTNKYRWLKRIATVFFFVAIPLLLFTLLKNIEWQEVKEALQSYEISTLLIGLAIAVLSYIVFASYDLIGKAYTKHPLSVWQVMPVGIVCYAFNLNLSTWVGGIALRLRLYSRLGLDVSTITKILSLSVLTNWLGYFIVAGIIFSLGLLDLPDTWKIGSTALQVIGIVLLAVAGSYLIACKCSKQRIFHIFKHQIELPKFRMALTQAALAATNWSLMGLLIFTLLPESQVNYPTVLGILLLSSIAGVITHIPGGIGVLETIFITMLQHQLSKGSILAALIGYRIIYFLIPLAIAVCIYFILESQAKKIRQRNETNETTNSKPQLS